jgi:hypothetical protein
MATTSFFLPEENKSVEVFKPFVSSFSSSHQQWP